MNIKINNTCQRKKNSLHAPDYKLKKKRNEEIQQS